MKTLLDQYFEEKRIQENEEIAEKRAEASSCEYLRWEDLTVAQKRAVDTFWETVETDDYECVDNWRYAIPGNQKQENGYDDIREKGCCGYEDMVLNCSDGTKLMYGFNYGH